MGRSRRRFVPRGGLLRFPYENRVPDEWRLGHSGKWICKDHHIPRQRLCVPVNCGGPPKAIHPTAFTGNRWTRSFLRDGTAHEQPDIVTTSTLVIACGCCRIFELVRRGSSLRRHRFAGCISRWILRLSFPRSCSESSRRTWRTISVATWTISGDGGWR